MRSIQNRNSNLGMNNAQPSAKSVVRRDADRPSLFAKWCASMCSSSRLRASLREELQHLTTATRVVITRVTGGALYTQAPQRSGRHAAMCRLAAR
jgi:hypothetical protein